MTEKIITAMLVLAGIINFLPIVGVLSVDKLTQLYAVDIGGSELSLLMRHRAVLLGIVGALLIASAFIPMLQTAAIVSGIASMLSFIALVYLIGEMNTQIQRVVVMDWLAISALMIAIILKLFARDGTT